jgi:hypothetical protein
MEDPSNGLGKTITWIDYTGNLVEIEVSSFLPVLEGKILYANMVRVLGRAAGIGHLDNGLIVFPDRSWSSLSETKLGKNGTEILGNFARGDSHNEFGFCS